MASANPIRAPMTTIHSAAFWGEVMPEGTLRFTVENQYSELVVVYSTASKPVTTPPSSDADAYQPVYTRLGTVAPSKKGNFTAASSPTRIVVTRQTDDVGASRAGGLFLWHRWQRAAANLRLIRAALAEAPR